MDIGIRLKANKRAEADVEGFTVIMNQLFVRGVTTS